MAGDTCSKMSAVMRKKEADVNKYGRSLQSCKRDEKYENCQWANFKLKSQGRKNATCPKLGKVQILKSNYQVCSCFNLILHDEQDG